jgi:hypothetical protein
MFLKLVKDGKVSNTLEINAGPATITIDPDLGGEVMTVPNN